MHNGVRIFYSEEFQKKAIDSNAIMNGKQAKGRGKQNPKIFVLDRFYSEFNMSALSLEFIIKTMKNAERMKNWSHHLKKISVLSNIDDNSAIFELVSEVFLLNLFPIKSKHTFIRTIFYDKPSKNTVMALKSYEQNDGQDCMFFISFKSLTAKTQVRFYMENRLS